MGQSNSSPEYTAHSVRGRLSRNSGQNTLYFVSESDKAHVQNVLHSIEGVEDEGDLLEHVKDGG